MMTPKEIEKTLNKYAMRIVFIKKDGSERNMLCSRDFKTINKYAEEFGYTPPQNPGSRPLPANLLRVWDLEKSGWRTINFDTIISAELDE